MNTFEGWYEAEHARVLAACAALCGDRDASCEATDEAFARALMCWERVGTMERPGAWVQTVALNCLRRTLRRRRREQILHRRRAPPPVEAPVANPEVWAAVRRLPQRQRLAVVLRYVVDLPEAEIAEVMGVTRGTVSASLSAARDSLAGMLADDDSTHTEVRNG